MTRKHCNALHPPPKLATRSSAGNTAGLGTLTLPARGASHLLWEVSMAAHIHPVDGFAAKLTDGDS
jgi:hypothetical protein